MLLTAFDPSEASDEFDPEDWLRRQLAFFLPRDRPQPKGKAKASAAKAKAGPAPKVGKFRLASFQCLRSLDNALRIGRGAGLAAFLPAAPGSDAPLPRRPLLTWHFDQASTNMAGAMFLAYHVKLRILPVMDIFHREWNDVSLAAQRAGCWSAVLLSSLAMNVPFGPWDGCGWWEKLKEGACDLASRTVEW